MDIIQDYISLLHHLLPSTFTNPLIQITTTIYGIVRAAQTYLSPLLAKVISQPDIASILGLVVILWLSMKIVGMALRSVIFWLSLVWTVVKWGVIFGVALWVWNRGPEGAAQDAQELMEVWMGEYKKFKGQADAYKRAEEAQIRFQAGQRGARGWR
ncbi:hypothetical protein N0V90_006790 [Kalmusia sp. IMI 367209]|nr:hypothetical protein N0V90_006790 [Kalmusia sp. IMI 367209]